MWRWIGILVTGYALGSIPVGFLVVRWLHGVDVREIGSGRTGGTNVLRAAGWKTALVVVLLDVLKAALAVIIAHWLDGPPVTLALAGAAAVVGHNHSIFLHFRGGAGTMAAIGGATALWPWSAAILAPVGLGTVLITRHASMGSIVVALLLPVVFATRAILGLGPWVYLVYGLLASALILWALRPNIRRLLRGEERRVNLGSRQRVD
jgi:glycerol-3-phosphate acyltransferase PlsY